MGEHSVEEVDLICMVRIVPQREVRVIEAGKERSAGLGNRERDRLTLVVGDNGRRAGSPPRDGRRCCGCSLREIC